MSLLKCIIIIFIPLGVVPEPKGQVETSRKDGQHLHEAPRLRHASLQSPPNAPQRWSSCQPHAAGSMADFAHLQCHTHAHNTGLHGLSPGPAAHLSKPRFPQHPTWHGPRHAADGPPSLPVSTQLQRQEPDGGRQEFQHRSTQDESQRAHSVDG